ncbi:U2 small nuclear ribonucleoprotein B'' isoform X1 [Olea europaea var. sylvestris]|uniref:U2 small nuclear ribonucleoprotein B'' isoform X1 n=1 Tax=Olea europaea var. sylvestris TaxID=158386 RepID=UPI000C1D0903|nr:U2 small nuclear ribonucleoprotein B'' isoform X1 [Olea europaea var. sylvestris]
MALPPPYDPYYLAQPEFVYSNDGNGINTLFVSGLPDDIKAREIHNLFRRRPGFENCQLKYTGRGNQVVAFATFANHQSAMAALHSLNGVKFDPQTGSTLHIELARSNSRRKNKPGSGPYVVIDNRTKSATDDRESSGDDASGDSDSDDPPGNHDSGNQDDSATEKSLGKAADGNNASAPENEQLEKTADGACSTLFIANLGPNCTQDELKQVISQYPGFNILKLRARGGMPVAFADFEGIEQATAAMNALQGISLPSSDRGGMHIEYARSKMRKA